MAETCTTCNLRTKRVYSTTVNSDQLATSAASPTAVSADGKYVLYNFTNTGISGAPGATGPLVAGIIYSVNRGLINPVVTISPDSGFDSAVVVTNSKFRRIYVLQEATSSTSPTTRLQIKSFTFINGTLSPTGQSVFLGRSIVNLIGGFITGKNFTSGNLLAVLTPDSRYLVVAYNSTSNITTDLGDITATVFDAQTLAEVGSTTVASGTNTTLAVFGGLNNAFALVNAKSQHPRDYFVISTGIVTTSSDTLTGPFTVKLFTISRCGQPTLVDSVNVPSFVNTTYAFQPACTYLTETLILTTGQVAVLPTDNSIFVDTSAVSSNISGDNRNLRIYNFNGKCLRILAAEAFEYGLVGSSWSPDASIFAVTTTNQELVPSPVQSDAVLVSSVEIGITQFYRLCDRGDCGDRGDRCDRVDCGNRVDRENRSTIEPVGKFTAAGAIPAAALFSPNGEFLFEGFAAYADYIGAVTPGVNYVKNVSVLRLGGNCIRNPFPKCKLEKECESSSSSSSSSSSDSSSTESCPRCH
jgi:hypothetical protein